MTLDREEREQEAYNKRLDHLIEVMQIQTTSYGQQDMIDYIEEYILELNDDSISYVIDDDNMYITKGEAITYPCVAAHMDTVHDIIKHFKVIQDDDVLFAVNQLDYSRAGIGGDDKAGIFIALDVMNRLDAVKVALFRDEEVGCVGSGNATMSWFEDVSLILQADRQGYEDFVKSISSTKLYSDEFSTAIADTLSSYGKKETLLGGLTDVYTLKSQDVGVCVANSSCGYYFPHSDEEIVIISEVFDTANLFYDIIRETHVDGERWLHAYVREHYDYRGANRYNYYGGYGGKYGEWGGYNDAWESDSGSGVDATFRDQELDDDDTGSASVIDGIMVECDSCHADISNNFDCYMDGYYCMECLDYKYVEPTPVSDIVANDIIKRTIADWIQEKDDSEVPY